LFIRLGDVFLVFALFMLFRRFLTNNTLLGIGQSTLPIYVFHYIILYGSFTGLGIYYFLKHSLPPSIIIPGALAFIILTTVLALKYERNKSQIKLQLITGINIVQEKMTRWIGGEFLPLFRSLMAKSRVAWVR